MSYLCFIVYSIIWFSLKFTPINNNNSSCSCLQKVRKYQFCLCGSHVWIGQELTKYVCLRTTKFYLPAGQRLVLLGQFLAEWGQSIDEDLADSTTSKVYQIMHDLFFLFVQQLANILHDFFLYVQQLAQHLQL